MIAVIRHRLARVATSLVFATLMATAADAGTVTGVVRNGTNGKPAAGVDVILIQLQGGMQPVANTKTDSEGRFHFDNPSLGTGPMLLRAVYRGVNYHEPVTPGKTNVDIQVFEPTDKPSAFAVNAHAVILQPNGAELLVGEEFNIQNKTQPPMAFYKADGSFVFNLPQGADFGQASAWGSSGMPVVQGTIDKGKGVEAIAYAFRPGESGVRLSYKMAYGNNRATVQNISPYATQRLMVVAPPSVQVMGEGLTPAGQEQGFAVYTRDNVAANTPITISISGAASLPAAQNGDNPHAGTNAVSGRSPSAEGPSPGVNSRLEQSRAEAPVASATAMPPRLDDNLKWILLGGFALVFALGAVYLWRRPQVISADGTIAMAGPPVAAAPRAARSHKSPAPAQDAGMPAAASAALADADREVRGSLDELKDSLFRVELRHQAGTISDDEYSLERERIQKVLRDLVRG